jgi:all-trans-8'-apo-beta-carotenal 15,15'-oxygenase
METDMAVSGMTRRQSMGFGVAVAGALATGGAVLQASPAPAQGAPAPEWLTYLGKSERGGRDYAPHVVGDIPFELSGALYRNGPGLYERGGLRKPHLLDGDGLVQRLSFHEGKVRYQNTFVRTQKFDDETKTNSYLYSTWSMRAPGGVFANLGGGKISSQAGVTVYPFNGALYAFDEVSPPWMLEPASLRTLGPKPIGDPSKTFMTKAHTKFDPVTGDWLLAGLEHGPSMKLHAITHAANGVLRSHQIVDSPRQVYIHDFFATERHFIFLLHPMNFSPWWMLAGFSTYIESMSWKREDGNLIMVLPRGGGTPRFFEAPGAFMWHALNAYERGGEMVADFVAYDAPDHFTPHDAFFYQVMQGRMGTAKERGKLRRYRIDLSRGSAHEEIVDSGTHEFPIVDPRVALHPHRSGFMTTGGLNVVNSGIKRMDYDTGRTHVYDFGPRCAVGEPVFAARPGGGENEGWLITQVLDGETRKSLFALFDSDHIAAGPIAEIRLPHHLPISFHGWWQAA